MSATTKHRGTTHHKIHSLTGYGLIIGLPFVIWQVAMAVGGGADGLLAWLSTPLGAIGFLLFFTAAVWYCKLEMDEVIMDYFGGGLRRFGLLKNKLVAFILWAAIAFAVIKLAFL